MKQRCYKPNHPAYKNYGGRGIKVCDEWLNDFKAFYNWARKCGYSHKLTLDRINNNGNYEPSNCRWATRKEQANNTRSNIRYTVGEETHTIAEWSRIIKVNPTVCGLGIKRNGVDYIKKNCLLKHKNY